MNLTIIVDENIVYGGFIIQINNCCFLVSVYFTNIFIIGLKYSFVMTYQHYHKVPTSIITKSEIQLQKISEKSIF